MKPSDYDRQINWEGRLGREWPFYKELFRKHGVESVLDCGCGTGRHAILFAQNGFRVTGVDMDPAMVDLARRNAAAEKVEARFETVSFRDIPSLFPSARFDAVICVGNSLSQLSGLKDVERAVGSMATVCKDRGLLIIHVLNYSSLMKKDLVLKPIRVIDDEGRKRLFQKVFLPRPHSVEVLMIEIAEGVKGWKSKASLGKLLPIMPSDLEGYVKGFGFASPEIRGDYSGGSFDPENSWDLILNAVKTGMV